MRNTLTGFSAIRRLAATFALLALAGCSKVNHAFDASTDDLASAIPSPSPSAISASPSPAPASSQAAFTISPTGNAFPATAIGSTADAVFTVTNSGAGDAASVTTSILGSGFVIQSNSCTGALAMGASCSITARFAPGTAGNYSALLQLSSPGAAPASAALTGTASNGVITLSQANLVFASTDAGSYLDQTLTITNAGAVGITGLTTAVTGAGFSRQSTTCTNTLASSATCNVVVRFSPSYKGSYGGYVQAAAANATTATGSLSGTGTSSSALGFTPASYGFGNVAVGSTGGTTFTVQNSGSSQSGVLTVSSLDAADFPVNSTTCGSALAAGASCTVSVGFAPSGVSSYASQIKVSDSLGATIVASVNGQGTAVKPVFAVSPTGVTFADTAVSAYVDQVFTLTNSGAGTAASVTASLIGSGFAIVSNGCSGALAPGASCNLTARFAPASAGSFNGFLQLSAAGADTATAQLSGNGTASSGTSGIFSLSPANVAFPSTNSGSFNDQTISISNSGSVAITGMTGSVSGQGFAQQSTTCTGTLASSASCNFVVRFSPTYKGSYGGFIQFTASNANPATGSLAGSGTSSSALALTPTSYNFGTVQVGQSGTLSLALQNTGASSSGTITVSSLNSSIFPVTSTDCSGTTLAPGASCQIVVGFSPAAASLYSSQVQVTDSLGGSVVAGLSGQGTVPTLAIAPTGFDFGALVIGGQATSSFTVTNSSATSAGGFNVSAIGSGYSILSNGCTTYSSTFPPGQSCTVSVRFSPASNGSFSGFIVASATGQDSVYADLSGSGAPVASLAMAPTGVSFGTVFTTVGATQTITLTNSGGVNAASVSLALSDTTNYSIPAGTNTCGASLAGGASCTFVLKYLPVDETTTTPTLTVSYDNGAVPKSTTLSASGTGRYAPNLALTPGNFDFGSITVGNVTSKTFTLTNSGSGYASGLTFASSDPSFVITANTCSTTLLSGASCNITLEFAPNRLTTFVNQTLTISYAEMTALSKTALTSTLQGLSANGLAWNMVGGNYWYYQIHFTDSLHGYLVGDRGQVRFTSDGGTTWSAGASGTYAFLYGIGAIDLTHFFSSGSPPPAGGSPTLFSTSNGGLYWQNIVGGSTYSTYRLDCPNSLYCGGMGQSAGFVTTGDGGNTWTQLGNGRVPTTVADQSLPDASNVYAAGNIFISASRNSGSYFYPQVLNWPMWEPWATGVNNTVYAVGNYGRVRKSTDGGVTWQNLNYPFRTSNGYNLMGTSCADDLTCWVSSNNGEIALTTDGGATWTSQRAPTNNQIFQLHAVNSTHVFGAGDSNYFYRTTDGVNWGRQAISGPGRQWESLACTDSLTCYVGGYGPGGVLVKTTDGGNSFNEIASSSDLQQLTTAGSTVWTVGLGGWIKRSTDLGATWTSIIGPSYDDAWAISFITDGPTGTGWMASRTGKIYKSTDDGNTWSLQASFPGRAFTRIFMAPDGLNGWVIGDGYAIYHTSNGGTTWTQQNLGNAGPYYPYGVQALWNAGNSNWDVWVVGMSAVNVMYSNDAGATWTNGTYPSGHNLYQIFMTSNTTGFASASHYSGSSAPSTVIKTTDGGHTWTQSDAGGTSNIYNFGLAFAATGGYQSGWVLGDNQLRMTTDGGTTWNSVTAPTYPFYSYDNVIHPRNMIVVDESGGINAIKLVATNVYGAIIRSVDSGNTWTQVNLANLYDLRGVRFSPDGTTGWASIYGKNAMLKTTDSGNTWSVVTYPAFAGCAANPVIYMMAVFDSQHMLAVSRGCGDLAIVTTDGGTTWSKISFPTQTTPGYYADVALGAAVVDPVAGTAVVTMNNGAIWRCTNFCTTSTNWTRETVEPASAINGIKFVNANQGWAVGGGGEVLTTANGGTVWSLQATLSGNPGLNSVDFTDANNGYIGADSQLAYRTTNGGAAWTSVDLSQLPTWRSYWNLKYLRMPTSTTAVGVTDQGSIALITGSTGVDVSATPPSFYAIRRIQAFDRRTAYAVMQGGFFEKTLDGGQTWSTLRPDTANFWDLNDLSFITANTGWMAGVQGRIWRTSNAGASWSQQPTPTTQTLWSVSMADSNNGWAVGNNNTILRTTAGTGWTAQTFPIGGVYNLTKVKALSSTVAIAVGSAGSILRTTDGVNWTGKSSSTSPASPTSNQLESLAFLNSTVGWAVGDAGTILYTSDGGQTWTAQTSNTTYNLYDVAVIDSNHAWIAGDGGKVLYTTNGGSTWVVDDRSVANGNAWLGIAFADLSNGWIVGYYGRVMRTFMGAQGP